MAITKSKAVEIAKKEARILNYSVELMDITVKPKIFKLDSFLKKYPDFVSTEGIIKLKDMAFWVIYFSPKATNGEIVFGGDLWIFVDSTDGKVLTTLRGK